MRRPSSPLAACGVLLAAIGVGALAARHRAERPSRAAAHIAADAAIPSGPLDLNDASADQLERLPRIGKALAHRIVADRERRGPFGSVDELDRVPGIGPATVEAVRPLVVVRSRPGHER
jgi:competence ComEA-like helix-hairpin-helix protein